MIVAIKTERESIRMCKNESIYRFTLIHRRGNLGLSFDLRTMPCRPGEQEIKPWTHSAPLRPMNLYVCD